MSKHTEGPWQVHEDNAGKRFQKDWRTIPGVIEPDWYERHKNGETETYCGVRITEANARLIAAAPDLLEACKEALVILPQAMDSDLDFDAKTKAEIIANYPLIVKLKAAIAKAEPPAGATK